MNKTHHTEPTSPESPRRGYKPPQLRVLGSVDALTAGPKSGSLDGLLSGTPGGFLEGS